MKKKQVKKQEKKTRINWQILKQDYIFSETISLKDFLVSKWILKENQKMPWWYIKQTKGWQEEKKEFRTNKLENFELSEEQAIQLAQSLDKGVSVFSQMFLYYSEKVLEKIKKNKKPIYVDELMKFWKFLEYYHKLKLWTEFETTVNVNVDNNDPLKDLLQKIDNAE